MKTPTFIKVCIWLMVVTVITVVVLFFALIRTDAPVITKTIITQECEGYYENEPVDAYDSLYRIQSKRFKK